MANPLVEEAKAALKSRPRAVPSSEVRAVEGGLSSHPMFADALETLQLQKKLGPEKYNELVNQHADEIARNIRMQLPGGKKGISYPVGTESNKIYFTDARGNLQWIPRERFSEIPEGAKVHNLTREDVVRELGGLREVPAAPKAAPSAASSEAEAIQEALDVTRAQQAAKTERPVSPEEGIYAEAEASRRAQEARQQSTAPETSKPSVPTSGYSVSEGPWGTAATKSPMPSILNDQAYAAWLKDVNRRANDLTQAGAATAAGALYYRGLPQGSSGQGEGESGGFTPRRDLPNASVPSTNYSPITDTAKEVLRQRLTSTPTDSEYRPDFDNFQNWTRSAASNRPTDSSEFARLDMMPPAGAGRGNITEAPGARALAAPSSSSSAFVRREPPLPPKRPAEFAPATEQGNQSLFSSLFDWIKPRDPYAGMSRQDMAKEAQRLQSSGDEYGANLLTQRLDRGITSDAQQSSDGGFKRGGTAKAGGASNKDAALHKALEIIHSMISRR